MATAKKKPSAAQLAARKEFSRIMKSGGFGAAKKKRAKNPVAGKTRTIRAPQGRPAVRRAKNPVGRSGASGRGVSTNIQSADDNGTSRSMNPSRRKGLGRSGASDRDRGFIQDPDSFRQMNPRGRYVHRKNPVSSPVRFTVYAARGGVKGKAIAAFVQKTDAVQYAKAWASLHNCPVLIGGKAR